jgi:protein phosphatase
MRPDSSIADAFEHNVFITLLSEAAGLLEGSPALLRLQGNFVVVGDLHGNVDDLIRIFQRYRYPPCTRYLFLGDYIDRGENSVEVLILLLALLQMFPEHVFLLRGNHETRALTRHYGFRDQCINFFGGCRDPYDHICRCFDALPVCAIINGKIFCVHGGISQFFKETSDLASLRVNSIISDLIWSDPKENIEKFTMNDRKIGHFFSKVAVFEFLDRNGLSMMIRAHSYNPRGYKWNFGEDGRCLTVFSSSDYMGKNNLAGIAVVTGEAVKTEIMAPLSKQMLAQRRILIPTWGLADQSPLKPPSLLPDPCVRLVC